MAAHEIDHVAVLVRSIDGALRDLHLDPGESSVEEFPAEGTRELYLGNPGAAGRLLLMQPTGDGPYQRAMQKRGPGLHHVAFCVDDLGSFVDTIADTGWLLHPASIRLAERSQQVWLCRPGVRALFEVTEETLRYEGAPMVDRVTVPAGERGTELIAGLRVTGLEPAGEGEATLTLGTREITLGGRVG